MLQGTHWLIFSFIQRKKVWQPVCGGVKQGPTYRGLLYIDWINCKGESLVLGFGLNRICHVMKLIMTMG